MKKIVLALALGCASVPAFGDEGTVSVGWLVGVAQDHLWSEGYETQWAPEVNAEVFWEGALNGTVSRVGILGQLIFPDSSQEPRRMLQAVSFEMGWRLAGLDFTFLIDPFTILGVLLADDNDHTAPMSYGTLAILGFGARVGYETLVGDMRVRPEIGYRALVSPKFTAAENRRSHQLLSFGVRVGF